MDILIKPLNTEKVTELDKLNQYAFIVHDKANKIQVKNAVEQNDHEEIEEEFGDLMFTMVNLSRFLHVNPEDSLRKAVDKFSVRFREVERSARKARKKMVEMTLAEMDEIWDQIKHNS